MQNLARNTTMISQLIHFTASNILEENVQKAHTKDMGSQKHIKIISENTSAMRTQKTYKVKNLKNFFKLPRKTKFKSKKEIEENITKRKMALQGWQEFMDLYKGKKKETASILQALQKDLQTIFPDISIFDEDFDEKVFIYISLAMMKIKGEIEFFRNLEKNFKK